MKEVSSFERNKVSSTYKMYKAGKIWLFAGALAVTIGATSQLDKVSADTTVTNKSLTVSDKTDTTSEAVIKQLTPQVIV